MKILPCKIIAITPFKVCDFLLVSDSNLHPVSHHFRVILHYWSSFRCLQEGRWPSCCRCQPCCCVCVHLKCSYCDRVVVLMYRYTHNELEKSRYDNCWYVYIPSPAINCQRHAVLSCQSMSVCGHILKLCEHNVLQTGNFTIFTA